MMYARHKIGLTQTWWKGQMLHHEVERSDVLGRSCIMERSLDGTSPVRYFRQNTEIPFGCHR
eukprot:scaffold8375_cov121-Skeletonema_menzelii.AAC.1